MNKVSRIKRVEVRNLFNRLNYDLDFRTNYPVNIFIGPNGTGKSTILNFITFCIEPRYKHLKSIYNVDFSSFVLELDNGYSLIMTKNKVTIPESLLARITGDEYIFKEAEKTISRFLSLEFKLVNKDGEIKYSPATKVFNLETLASSKLFSQSGLDVDEGLINDYTGLLVDLDGFAEVEGYKFLEYWLTGNTVNALDLYKRLELDYPKANKEEIYYATRAVFAALCEIIIANSGCYESNLKMIDADRSDDRYFYDTYSRFSMMLDLSIYVTKSNRERLKRFNQLQTKYSLSNSEIKSYEQFIIKRDNYRSLKKQYVEAGLIETFDDVIDLDITEEKYNLNKIGYCAYLLEALEALPFSDDRLFKFLKFINNRFEISEIELFLKRTDSNYCLKQMHKTIYKNDLEEYTKSEFMLMARSSYDKSNEFSVYSLSTGQKHDLVMFYNLLFMANENDTFLIDEPEISQHIDVQEMFIDELEEICCDKRINCIVATHSPFVISDHINEIVDKKVWKNGQ